MSRCMLLAATLALVHACWAASAPEVATLTALFRVLEGEHWFVKDGWSTIVQGGSVDPCRWFGVTCDANASIAEIDLRLNNLRGDSSAVNFTPLTGLTRIDLSNNGLNGTINATLFSLPAISVVRLSRNALTEVPTVLVRGPVSPSLRELRLERNRFRCPVPRPAQLVDVAAAAWIDINSTTCVSTRSRTVPRSQTVIVEPPVPTLGANVTTIVGLTLTTGLDTTQTNTSALFLSVLTAVAITNGVLSGNVANVSLEGVLQVSSQTSSTMVVLFASGAPLDFRQDVYARFRANHVSVRRLLVSRVVVLEQTLSPGDTGSPPATRRGLSRGPVTAILVVGVVLVIVLFAAVGICWFRRRKAFTVVQPTPGIGAPVAKSQLVAVRSFRRGSLSTPGGLEAFGSFRRPRTPTPADRG